MVALSLIVRRRYRRRHRGFLRETKSNVPKPFILPPDPAIVQGSQKLPTFLFGKRTKSSPSDTAPGGTVSTNTAPSTHNQSGNVDALSHCHMTSTSTTALGSQPGNSNLVPDETERQDNRLADLSAAELFTRKLVQYVDNTGNNYPQTYYLHLFRNSTPIPVQDDESG
jgi:hypothetical protein